MSRGGRVVVEDPSNGPLGVDDVGDAPAERKQAHEGSGLECLGDLARRVRDELEGEPVLLGEACVAVGRVAADADDLRAMELDELLARVPERARLERSAGREVFRVEKDDDRAAEMISQPPGRAVRQRALDVGRLRADRKCHASPPGQTRRGRYHHKDTKNMKDRKFRTFFGQLPVFVIRLPLSRPSVKWFSAGSHPDLSSAIQALSQPSYGPKNESRTIAIGFAERQRARLAPIRTLLDRPETGA